MAKTATKTFHKYTVSINFYGVEVRKLADGGFLLQAHKAFRNIKGKQATVTAEEWADRPFDHCDDTVEALWALRKCGIEFA